MLKNKNIFTQNKNIKKLNRTLMLAEISFIKILTLCLSPMDEQLDEMSEYHSDEPRSVGRFPV